MALEINFDLKELGGNKSFVIKDISAPSYTQTGWAEGTNPSYTTLVDNIKVFNLTLPDDSVVDLSTYWNSVVNDADSIDDLYLEVTNIMIGLDEDDLLEDGEYTIDFQVDPSGAGTIYGVTITFLFTGRIEQVLYELSSNISDYYGSNEVADKTYVNDIIVANNLLKAINYNVRATRFEEATTLFNNLTTLLEKYE